MVRSRRRQGKGRRRDEGSALVVALLVLLLTSLAGALVAAELAVILRSGREDADRVRLRALLDAGTADALARLAEEPWSRGGEVELDGGRARSEILLGDDDDLRIVRVEASFRARTVVAELEVRRKEGDLPRVLSWRRVAGVTRR